MRDHFCNLRNFIRRDIWEGKDLVRPLDFNLDAIYATSDPKASSGFLEPLERAIVCSPETKLPVIFRLIA